MTAYFNTVVNGEDVPLLSGESTIAEACGVWLEEKRTADRVTQTTIEAYENSVRLIVVPMCGSIQLMDFNVPRCDSVLRRILKSRSPSDARKARGILSQVCGTAVRVGVMASNPVRDAQDLPTSEKKDSFLLPEQIGIVRDLMRSWKTDRSKGGTRPDVSKLEDGMFIMIGTSARIGEVLALRRRDVDLLADKPTIHIASTLTQTRKDGLTRKNSPKHKRQKRRVHLPKLAVEAVRSRLSEAGPKPDDFLFATRSGAPFSVSNFERLMRTFLKGNIEAMRDADIPVEEFTTHIFRRTSATLVERRGGIGLASRLLGHANEGITRAHYVVTDELVSDETATILDETLVW
ncbi:tyrosine-type recombinase/integrase [Leifsonia kafniensis]|uniref:Tyrosine-type recombinase/integrase n=1 Tax=Leifsonia kafniensis TaxID=475957 RepID=A0ABP7KAR9_9MICO